MYDGDLFHIEGLTTEYFGVWRTSIVLPQFE